MDMGGTGGGVCTDLGIDMVRPPDSMIDRTYTFLGLLFPSDRLG